MSSESQESTSVAPPTTTGETTSPRAAAFFGLVLGLVLGAILATGVAALVGNNPSEEDPAAANDFASSDEVAQPEPEETGYVPTADDFSVDLTITDQQCFGSAGCNVTFRVEPNYEGYETPAANYDITYEVRGVEDGPLIETFSIEDDQFSFNPEINAQTVRPGKKVRAVVTDIVESY